ncbi:MAG: hypothetical protein JXA21_02305 [Anaerolineae bacterium]|nr:hypothetical protein [Anaerolineae bacterium]
MKTWGLLLSIVAIFLSAALSVLSFATSTFMDASTKTPEVWNSDSRSQHALDFRFYLPTITRNFNASPVPDFILTVTPISQTVMQGQSAVYTVSLTPLHGFTAPVYLSFSGVLSGETSWDHTLLTPTMGTSNLPVVSMLALTTTANGYTGSHSLFITGTSGVLQHAVIFTLTVSPLPVVRLWQSIPLDPEYSGGWVVAGDLDGDDVVDIVSAQNHNQDGVHYASAVVAQRLDGSILWRWGDPSIGQKCLSYDVPVQIYDWDGDGTNEVVLLTKVGSDSFLVELEGATGFERRRFSIPTDATDSIVFANVSGNDRATDVLVKTRYTQVWAYTYAGELLWTYRPADKALTAHQPRPIDIDGDSRDEIMAGFSLLNADGSVRWTYASKGHLDTMRVLRMGTTPDEFRLVITACGGKTLAVLDGNGQTVWKLSGYHFESVDIGPVCSQIPGNQIVVDIDHQPFYASPLWILDEDGVRLSEISTYRSRHHRLIDWTGAGIQSLVISEAIPPGLFDCSLHYVATFELPRIAGDAPTNPECVEGALPGSLFLVEVGDMTGDRIPDILLHSLAAVYIFENENGLPLATLLGTEINVTLY